MKISVTSLLFINILFSWQLFVGFCDLFRDFNLEFADSLFFCSGKICSCCVVPFNPFKQHNCWVCH